MKNRAGLWAWLLAAGLTWLVVYPLVLVLVDGLREPGGWTLQHVDRFVSRPGEWQALWAEVDGLLRRAEAEGAGTRAPAAGEFPADPFARGARDPAPLRHQSAAPIHSHTASPGP